MTIDIDEEARDRAYTAGERAAWSRMLKDALIQLGDAAPNEARLALQLEETRAALRRICEEFGDNDWPDNLWLPDVIEKHLARHLRDDDD